MRWLLRKASRVKHSVHHLVARRELGIIAPPMFHSCVRKLVPQKIACLLETGSQGTALHPIFAVELPDHKLAVGHDAQDSNLKPSTRAKSDNKRFVLRLVTSPCPDKLSMGFEEIAVAIEHPICDRGGSGIASGPRVCGKHCRANIVGTYAMGIKRRSSHTRSPPKVGRSPLFQGAAKEKRRCDNSQNGSQGILSAPAGVYSAATRQRFERPGRAYAAISCLPPSVSGTTSRVYAATSIRTSHGDRRHWYSLTFRTLLVARQSPKPSTHDSPHRATMAGVGPARDDGLAGTAPQPAPASCRSQSRRNA
jgi:hypothetical protein